MYKNIHKSRHEMLQKCYASTIFGTEDKEHDCLNSQLQ